MILFTPFFLFNAHHETPSTTIFNSETLLPPLCSLCTSFRIFSFSAAFNLHFNDLYELYLANLLLFLLIPTLLHLDEFVYLSYYCYI